MHYVFSCHQPRFLRLQHLQSLQPAQPRGALRQWPQLAVLLGLGLARVSRIQLVTYVTLAPSIASRPAFRHVLSLHESTRFLGCGAWARVHLQASLLEQLALWFIWHVSSPSCLLLESICLAFTSRFAFCYGFQPAAFRCFTVVLRSNQLFSLFELIFWLWINNEPFTSWSSIRLRSLRHTLREHGTLQGESPHACCPNLDRESRPRSFSRIQDKPWSGSN